MDVYLHTLGCRLNEAELESWHRGFDTAGHRVVRTPEQAQVMVLNTCAVTSVAARKSRQIAGRMHRKNPEASLVVTGCYAEMDPEKVASLAGVDLVVGNHDKNRLVELVEEGIDLAAMPRMATEPDAQLYASARTRAFVKVQDGCRNKCSFCVVTILRGEERSKTIDDVIAEIHTLEDQGYQEVILTGVHLGGYGSDLGTDLYALLRAVLDRTSVPRLRVTSLEPWDIPEHFWTLWEDPRLGGHLHLPLQSGCDSVLRRMSRRCTTDNYRKLVESARAHIPDLTLTTDVIVGFPGETAAEYAATRSFIESIGFAHMHIFTWSPREGTRATRLPGRLDKPTQRERSHDLHALGDTMKRAHLDHFVGQTRPVLWEGDFETLDDGSRRWLGYTDNYLRVATTTDSDTVLENTIEPVVLTEHDGARFTGQRQG